MHFCVNLVCLSDSASAVLLRAGAVVVGEELARARRTWPTGVRRAAQAPRGKALIAFRDLARGPARLCQALGIDRSLDGTDVCVPGSRLRVRWPDAGTTARSAEKIATGPRVGVSAAAEVPWRFWVEGDPTVSAYRAHVPRRKPVTS
jgi:DNA-3-methyladenine glycosylase